MPLAQRALQLIMFRQHKQAITVPAVELFRAQHVPTMRRVQPVQISHLIVLEIFPIHGLNKCILMSLGVVLTKLDITFG